MKPSEESSLSFPPSRGSSTPNPVFHSPSFHTFPMLEGTISNTLGAGFLGCVAACILFGVTVVQTWMYYNNYPNDWAYQKLFVAILLALDALHLSVTIHAMYHYMIIEFGNVLGLQKVVWSFKLQTTLNVLIVFLVQCLYTYRVWKLGRYRSGGTLIKAIPPLITCLLISAGVVGFILAYKVFNVAHFENIRQTETKWAVSTSFIMSTVTDIILAAAICYYLYSSRTGFSSTNNRLAVIIHYVLISGAFTAACSLSALITFLIMPNNMIFLGISFLLTKLYINSYMAMLNARDSGRENESSSLNVSKIMNRKPRHKTIMDGPATQLEGDQDSLTLSTIGYTGKDAGDNLELDRAKKADLSTSFGGVTIHRIEERQYDDDKNWSHV